MVEDGHGVKDLWEKRGKLRSQEAATGSYTLIQEKAYVVVKRVYQVPQDIICQEL